MMRRRRGLRSFDMLRGLVKKKKKVLRMHSTDASSVLDQLMGGSVQSSEDADDKESDDNETPKPLKETRKAESEGDADDEDKRDAEVSAQDRLLRATGIRVKKDDGLNVDEQEKNLKNADDEMDAAIEASTHRRSHKLKKKVDSLFNLGDKEDESEPSDAQSRPHKLVK